MHTISQEYLIKLPIGYSVFLLLLQLLFFHLNLSLNSLFRFTFSLVCLTRAGCLKVMKIKVKAFEPTFSHNESGVITTTPPGQPCCQHSHRRGDSRGQFFFQTFILEI